MFTLAALLAWERARDGSPAAWRAATMLLFVAAMGARESAWTLPFALVLVEVARGERMRDALRRTLPFWGLALVLAALVLAIAPYRQLLATSLSIRSPLDNLVAQVDSVVYLVTHPLLTLRLNFDPDLVARESIDGAWLAKVGALAALLALGVAQLRKRPWLGFGVLWFFLALAPTHGPLARYELANDRQLYLAIVGPALIAGVLLASWSARRAASVALAALAVVLGAATFVRVTDYASEVRLWEATVRASPGNARAWNNLGHAWQVAGDREQARAAYEHALAIDPQHRKARGNLNALGSR
jgi:tetratricopeptide (TPR) repeat protein